MIRVLDVVATAVALTLLAAPALADPLADFVQVKPRNAQPARVLAYRNSDTINTTVTVTKTPIYKPVLDRNGNVIGQRIAGYTTTRTSSTLVTPQAHLFSTNGSTNALFAPLVSFDFLQPVKPQFAGLLTGTQSAQFMIDAWSANPVLTDPADAARQSQLFDSGTISFTRAAPIVIGATSYDNLLTIQFTNANLVTSASGLSLIFDTALPGETADVSSDFVDVPAGGHYAFMINLARLSPALAIAPLNPALTNVTGARSFINFRSNADGNIEATVPEPASWALMIIGFGVVSVALRRRRTVALAA